MARLPPCRLDPWVGAWCHSSFHVERIWVDLRAPQPSCHATGGLRCPGSGDLITRRSRVRIPPPLCESPALQGFRLSGEQQWFRSSFQFERRNGTTAIRIPLQEWAHGPHIRVLDPTAPSSTWWSRQSDSAERRQYSRCSSLAVARAASRRRSLSWECGAPPRCRTCSVHLAGSQRGSRASIALRRLKSRPRIGRGSVARPWRHCGRFYGAWKRCP
jgi:hypothetical protein